jgi:hypothetical protein
MSKVIKLSVKPKSLQVENNKEFITDNIEKKFGGITLDSTKPPEKKKRVIRKKKQEEEQDFPINEDKQEEEDLQETNINLSPKINISSNETVNTPIINETLPSNFNSDYMIRRGKMLSDINRFREKLGKYLDEIDFTGLELKSNEQLEQIINDIAIQIKIKGNEQSRLYLYGIGFTMLENIAVQMTPVKCQGLKDSLLENKEVLDIITEINMKYRGNLMDDLEPEYRLAIAILYGMSSLHKINTAGDKGFQNLTNNMTETPNINNLPNRTPLNTDTQSFLHTYSK